MTIELTSDPIAAPDLDALFVTIRKVEVRHELSQPNGSSISTWRRVDTGPQTLDVASLQGGLFVTIASVGITPGPLTAVRLTLAEEGEVVVAGEHEEVEFENRRPVATFRADLVLEHPTRLLVSLGASPEDEDDDDGDDDGSEGDDDSESASDDGSDSDLRSDSQSDDDSVSVENDLDDDLVPGLRLIEMTVPITPVGTMLITGAGVRLVIPRLAVRDRVYRVTLQDLVADDLTELLGVPIPVDQFSFLTGIDLRIETEGGVRRTLRRSASIELDNTSDLPQGQIPLGQVVVDVTGDGRADLQLVGVAAFGPLVLRAGRTGFLRGIESSGAYALLASSGDLAYAFERIESPTRLSAVVATSSVDGVLSPFLSVSDNEGRYVVPVRLPAPSGAIVTLTDPVLPISKANTILTETASSGAFILADTGLSPPVLVEEDFSLQPAGATRVAARPQPTFTTFSVITPGADLFVAVNQGSRQARSACAVLVFPNPLLESVQRCSTTVVQPGALVLEPAFRIAFGPDDFPNGWSLQSHLNDLQAIVRSYAVDPITDKTFETESALTIQLGFALPDIGGLDGRGDPDGDGICSSDEFFLHGTDAFAFDSDGDGFADFEEILSVADGGGRNTIELKNVALPFLKDIFVEVDWMSTVEADGDIGPDAHKPTDAAIRKVRNGFLAEGIVLHVDISNEVPHRKFLVAPNQDVILEVEAIRDSTGNLDPNRVGIYHYALFAHLQFDGEASSGRAEPFAPNDTFTVTHGLLPLRHADVLAGIIVAALIADEKFLAASLVDPVDIQDLADTLVGGTFMHELGHTLTLEHGGDVSCPNNEPNYMSVMNYRYQIGVDDDCDAEWNLPLVETRTEPFIEQIPFWEQWDRRVSYSHGDMMPLDEGPTPPGAPFLNEAAGLSGQVGTKLCGDRPIDWNRNGSIELDRRVNINVPRQVELPTILFDLAFPGDSRCAGDDFPDVNFPQFQELTDNDDWTQLDHFPRLSQPQPSVSICESAP